MTKVPEESVDRRCRSTPADTGVAAAPPSQGSSHRNTSLGISTHNHSHTKLQIHQ